MAAANREFEKVKQVRSRRKRGKYRHYDDETRVKIAKYSCEHGNKQLLKKLTMSLKLSKKSYVSKEKDPERILMELH